MEDQLPVVRCRNCGLIYVDSEGKDHIESQRQHWEDLYSDLCRTKDDGCASRKTLFNKYLNSQKGRELLVAKKRILDVGCGEGIFLGLLVKAGAEEIYGVDKSESAIQFLRGKNGITVVAGELRDANYRDDFFDLITLWDVFEHVTDPRSVLAEIRRILRKGGTLLIRVPNAHYLFLKYLIWGKVFGRKKCFIPRYHYYNFSPENLWRILHEEGFRNIEMRPGIPEIYGSLVRRVVHRVLYAMSLLIYMVMRRVAFTCFMIEAEAGR